MKKHLFILSSLLLPVAAVAQETVEPKLVEGVYALKMTPSGNWLGSMAGDASLYNVATGENKYYEECLLGLGNPVAENGMAVGNQNDTGVIMYNGQKIYPETLGGNNFWFCDINGITPDATRICGILNNPDKDSETLYVPFVADMDASGNVGTPTILPFPELDFFGVAPQYVTAVWISEDGATIIGEVLDWRGMYTYPITFTQGSNGTWNYDLPSESLFNPTGINITDNPWKNEPPYPEPENYMSGTNRDAYLEAYEKFSEGLGPEPYIDEYMTDEEFNEYLDAYMNFNNWYYSNEDAIKDYVKVYQEVLSTSPTFSDNELTIAPSGEYMTIRGGMTDASGDVSTKIFKFGIAQSGYETFDTPTPEFYPSLILKNGTLVITKGQMDVPTSMLMLPNSKEFITIQDYFQGEFASVAEWLDATVPGGTGVVSINDDMTFFTGALVPDQLANYNEDTAQFYYSTYFIVLPYSGVESILAEPEDGIYRAYNLQGVKMIETKKVEEVNALPGGMYIINGKKVLLAK